MNHDHHEQTIKIIVSIDPGLLKLLMSLIPGADTAARLNAAAEREENSTKEFQKVLKANPDPDSTD